MLHEFEFKFHPEFFDDLDKLGKHELEAANKQIEKITQNPLRYKRLRGRENCFSVRSVNEIRFCRKLHKPKSLAIENPIYNR